MFVESEGLLFIFRSFMLILFQCSSRSPSVAMIGTLLPKILVLFISHKFHVFSIDVFYSGYL